MYHNELKDKNEIYEEKNSPSCQKSHTSRIDDADLSFPRGVRHKPQCSVKKPDSG